MIELICKTLDINLLEKIDEAIEGDPSAWMFLHELFFPPNHETLQSKWTASEFYFTDFLKEYRKFLVGVEQ